MAHPMTITRRMLLGRAGASLLYVALAGTLGACSAGVPTAGQPTAGDRTASGPTGTNLELLWPTSIDDFAGAAQIYQADLAKIGVVVTLKPTEPAVFLPTILRGSYEGLALVVGANGHLQPANLLQGVVYSPEVNYAGFKNDEYTHLVNQVLVTTDPSTQRLLYARLNDYLLDQSFVLPITQSPPRLAARANVRGLRYDAHEALVLSEVWLT